MSFGKHSDFCLSSPQLLCCAVGKRRNWKLILWTVIVCRSALPVNFFPFPFFFFNPLSSILQNPGTFQVVDFVWKLSKSWIAHISHLTEYLWAYNCYVASLLYSFQFTVFIHSFLIWDLKGKVVSYTCVCLLAPLNFSIPLSLLTSNITTAAQKDEWLFQLAVSLEDHTEISGQNPVSMFVLELLFPN